MDIKFSLKEIEKLSEIVDSLPLTTEYVTVRITGQNGVGAVKSVIIDTDITDYDSW